MANKSAHLRTTLIQFYNQPVAQVSVELFSSIGTIIFFALFAIRPTLLTMADLIKEIDDKKALNQKLAQKVAALSTVQTQYLALESRLPVLDEALPPQPQFEETLKIIEKLASERKLIINSIQVNEIPQAEPENVPFAKKKRVSVPIQVIVQGDYATIRNFIEDIQNVRRTLIVDLITFAVTEEQDSKQLGATITINMQYFGTQNNATKSK